MVLHLRLISAIYSAQELTHVIFPKILSVSSSVNITRLFYHRKAISPHLKGSTKSIKHIKYVENYSLNMNSKSNVVILAFKL